jgi:PncC family amidohydrolase
MPKCARMAVSKPYVKKVPYVVKRNLQLRTNTQTLIEKLIRQRVHVRTAESCTGGGICDQITSVDGASKIVDFCMAAYSPEVKQKCLGCHPSLTTDNTIVSAPTSRQMARGLRALCVDTLCLTPFPKTFYVGITGWLGAGWVPEERVRNTAFVTIVYGNRASTYHFKSTLSSKLKSDHKLFMISQILHAIDALMAN